jgi:hypothetical protein
VGGTAADEYDIAQAAGRDTVVIIPLVLPVILLVIAVLLRAIVAPVVLAATTARRDPRRQRHHLVAIIWIQPEPSCHGLLPRP